MGERTTIVLDEELARQLRIRAGKKGIGLSRLIGDLLRSAMNTRMTGNEKPYRLEWPTTRGRLMPGVDLDDRDRLYDIMENSG